MHESLLLVDWSWSWLEHGLYLIVSLNALSSEMFVRRKKHNKWSHIVSNEIKLKRLSFVKNTTAWVIFNKIA